MNEKWLRQALLSEMIVALTMLSATAPLMVKGEKLLSKINGTTTRVENNGEYNVLVVAYDGAWIR